MHCGMLDNYFAVFRQYTLLLNQTLAEAL